jgi:uncharacterized protein (DUF1499 family)
MKRLFFVMIGCMVMTACSGTRPDNLGVTNGMLADCPSSPNCVNSQATDEEHAVPAFTYECSRQEAFDRLKTAVLSCDRMTVVEEKNDYLRIECTSAIMGYVDDEEFYFPEEKVIEVRSASRIGYSDLGVNRDRVEYIRGLFNAESIDAQ